MANELENPNLEAALEAVNAAYSSTPETPGGYAVQAAAENLQHTFETPDGYAVHPGAESLQYIPQHETIGTHEAPYELPVEHSATSAERTKGHTAEQSELHSTIAEKVLIRIGLTKGYGVVGYRNTATDEGFSNAP